MAQPTLHCLAISTNQQARTWPPSMWAIPRIAPGAEVGFAAATRRRNLRRIPEPEKECIRLASQLHNRLRSVPNLNISSFAGVQVERLYAVQGCTSDLVRSRSSCGIARPHLSLANRTASEPESVNSHPFSRRFFAVISLPLIPSQIWRPQKIRLRERIIADPCSGEAITTTRTSTIQRAKKTAPHTWSRRKKRGMPRHPAKRNRIQLKPTLTSLVSLLDLLRSVTLITENIFKCGNYNSNF
jgi:hypothetical protein